MIHALLMGLPILLGGFGCACGVSASVETQEPSHVERAVLTNPKRINYNDNAYQVTLSVDELNDYTWDNLVNLLDDSDYISDYLSTFQSSTSITYDNETYIYDDWVSTEELNYTYNGYFITLDFVSKKFELNLRNLGEDNYVDFEDELTWNLEETSYDSIKSAIQQDIIDNTSMPSIADIFSEVTQAITAFVGSLGTAFTQVTSLFYADGAWTFLGVLVLIGVGVGILYGVYRIIKGLLHRV